MNIQKYDYLIENLGNSTNGKTVVFTTVELSFVKSIIEDRLNELDTIVGDITPDDVRRQDI